MRRSPLRATTVDSVDVPSNPNAERSASQGQQTVEHLANRVGERAVRRPFSRYDWERLPADPDPEVDLGYDVVDWDRFEAGNVGESHLMFLPRDPELLRDDAFVIVDERVVCDLAFFA